MLAVTNSRPPVNQQGWQAELRLEFSKAPLKTVLTGKKQRGPLAIQRSFYPEGDTCHGYVLHPPGGVVGGDELLIHATVNDAAGCLLTTPGATKFYRSNSKLASQHQHFVVNNGCLEWLPQENIFFPQAHCALSTHVDLDEGARFIGWEVHCLGRPANNENFIPGSLSLRTEVFRNSRPSYIDCLRITNEADLTGTACLRGMPVLATLIATPASQHALELSRACCTKALANGFAGTTLFNDVLIVRYLGTNTAEAHQLLREVWTHIRPLINGRKAVPPRIWAT